MHLKQQIFLRVAGLLTLVILGIGTAFTLYSLQRNREMTRGSGRPGQRSLPRRWDT